MKLYILEFGDLCCSLVTVGIANSYRLCGYQTLDKGLLSRLHRFSDKSQCVALVRYLLLFISFHDIFEPTAFYSVSTWLIVQYDFSEMALFHVQLLCQQSADHVASCKHNRVCTYH